MQMSDVAIETNGLTVYYGDRRGVDDVNLRVERGEVFGFLGPNGAGKTTTLRVLMDVIRPTSGRAAIFGLDCQTNGVAVRRRVGYLPGELSLYSEMRASDLLDLLASLHERKGDRRNRDHLCERLDLDPSRRMREYSRGNKQKVGIVAAFMMKSDLLILDEPTSGLDPLVQRTVLQLVREARRQGRTILFSSHILSEVQSVCDRVGVIREGRLIETERIQTLIRQQFRRLHLTLEQIPPADAFVLEGVTETGRDGRVVMFEIQGALGKVIERASQYGLADIDMPPVTLEEIFIAFYGRDAGGNDA